jgi:hypothetical protein
VSTDVSEEHIASIFRVEEISPGAKENSACHQLSRWFLAELISSTLKMEAMYSSGTSVDTQWTTRRYIPEHILFITTAVKILNPTMYHVFSLYVHVGRVNLTLCYILHYILEWVGLLFLLVNVVTLVTFFCASHKFTSSDLSAINVVSCKNNYGAPDFRDRTLEPLILILNDNHSTDSVIQN